MKCPKCNGDRMATYTSTSTWFQPDSEPFESGVLEKIDTIETYVDVGVHHCLDCEHEEFWLEDPRSPLEAEVERLREALLGLLPSFAAEEWDADCGCPQCNAYQVAVNELAPTGAGGGEE